MENWGISGELGDIWGDLNAIIRIGEGKCEGVEIMPSCSEVGDGVLFLNRSAAYV